MQEQISRRSFISSGAGVALACLSSAMYARYEAKADEAANDVVLRFSALSDVHFKKNRDCVEADRFARCMNFMSEYSAKQSYKNFDAMLIAGDMTDHGWDDELLFFKEVMDKGTPKDTTTIICMGNHEFIGGSKARWEEIFERPSNKVYSVNGFTFIALSPEKGTNRNGDFQYALDWYQKELDEATAADPNKPIFTFQHYHVSPTVYGSRGEDNWGIADLYEPLQKYPRVINFSGHSHYPINDPRSAWQGRFTAFGTGTLSYFEMGSEGGRYNKFPEGYRNAAQFYVVEVRRDNSVVLKPYDLITDSFFDVVYIVAKPGDVDKYLYTDERYKTSAKPVWDESAKIDVAELESDLAVLSFPQATCKDVAHSYRVEIEKRDANSWSEYSKQYFWSEYYFKNQPKVMRVELDLEEQSTFRAKVVALNPFFKESEKALETEFTTPRDEQNAVDKDAPKPEANVFNLKLDKGKAINAPVNNLKEQKTLETFGSPEIVTDATLGALAVRFNGKDERLKIKFTSRDYRKLGRATIAAKFRFEAFRTEENMVVFANTEGNGLSLEINGKTKSLEFWASVNGKYRIVSAPIKEGETINAYGVYDGKDVVLYINGKEAARKSVPGRLTYPTDAVVQAFCVGSDIASSGSGSNFFKGLVFEAKIYSWALTAEQVANLCQ